MIGNAVLVGLTTSYVDGEQRLGAGYVRAVEQAGGVPVILPMVQDVSIMRPVLETLDALVVPGGPAVTIGLNGTLPSDISETPPIRQDSDLFYLRFFLASDRPVLGVCYGMQLLNAALGGTIYSDVEEQLPAAICHSQKRGAEDHLITISEGSNLAEIMGTTHLVNTRHIQAVERAADNLQVSATAEDGVIEALESSDGRLIGVQFHPEMMDTDGAAGLFKYLISRARKSA